MQEGIKIKCWDQDGAEGSIELNLDNDKEEAFRVIHFVMPMLDATKQISTFLPDLKLAIKRLFVEE